MSRHLDRLRNGEPWRAADRATRTLGILLLAGCYRFSLIAHRMSMAPHREATIAEFAVCLAAFLALTGGLAFVLEGAGLFRHVPIPKRNAHYWEGR